MSSLCRSSVACKLLVACNPRLLVVLVVFVVVVSCLLTCFFTYYYLRQSVVVSPSNLLSSPPIPSSPPVPLLVVEEDAGVGVGRGKEVSIASGMSEEVSDNTTRDLMSHDHSFNVM